MSNIVWTKPDGGIAVTTFAPEALERMAWARENAALLEQKIEFVADEAALHVALQAATEQLERVKGECIQLLRAAAGELGLEVDELLIVRDNPASRAAMSSDLQSKLSDIDGKEELIVELDEGLKKHAAELRDVLANLAAIARLEHIRDSDGFDEHSHELVLKRRAQEHVDEMAKVGVTVRPRVLDYLCVAHGAEVPADGTYREAWRWSGTEIEHDLAKAREIHKNLMRTARALKFQALDVQAMRAQEQGIELADVSKRKQALRDVTADPGIAAATTLDELRAVWPDCLK